MSRTDDAMQDEIAEQQSFDAAGGSPEAGAAGGPDAGTSESQSGARQIAAGSGTSALVPASPPRSGRFVRWVQRMTERMRPSPPAVAVPSELRERVRALEAQFAAHEEQTAKRLAEGEARALHLLQQRMDALERELTTSLRDVVTREVEERTAGLRRRLAFVGLLAVAASVGAGLALAQLLGVVAR